MSPAAPDRPSRRIAHSLLAGALAAWMGGVPLVAQSATDMVDTKHNLSLSGPGPIQAQGETRICIFCHTPHNAAPDCNYEWRAAFSSN